MTLKEMMEKAGELANRIKEAGKQAEGREFTAEEKENWEKLNADYNALRRDIDRAKRIEELDAQNQPPAGEPIPGREDTPPDNADTADSGNRQMKPEEQRALALQAWMRSQVRLALTDEHRQAADALHVDLNVRDLAIPLMPMSDLRRRQMLFRNTHPGALERALSVNLGATGGFTIRQGFVDQIEDALLWYGGMRQVAEIITTDTGERLPWPTDNDTTNTGEMLAEGSAVTEANPAFGQVNLDSYTFSSKMVRVPVKLLRDSAFDLAAWLANKLGERIGRAQNTKFTTGIGGSEPHGIVTGATLGVTADSDTAIDWDELKDLIHAVDVAYRTGARWMFHDSTALALRKVRDGMGREIWQSNAREGLPDTIEGYPVTLNNDMATIAASAKTVLFGQFTKYKIREVRTVILRRFVERYGEYNEEGFVAFLDADGALIDAGTHPVKYLQQST